jgi:uncharacterized protein DUF732
MKWSGEPNRSSPRLISCSARHPLGWRPDVLVLCWGLVHTLGGTMFRLTAVLSAPIAAALVGAAPAQCDANSYLDYLNSHGTFVYPSNDATKVTYGLRACDMLHAGMTPEQVAAWPSPSDAPGIIDAAQHELCPDTLH